MPGQEERGLSYDREFRLARSARFRERRDTLVNVDTDPRTTR
jgi:hypothetical protein